MFRKASVLSGIELWFRARNSLSYDRVSVSPFVDQPLSTDSSVASIEKHPTAVVAEEPKSEVNLFATEIVKWSFDS